MVYAQLSASIDKVFHCLDADGNGSLDRDELKAGFAAMVHLAPTFPIMLSPLLCISDDHCDFALLCTQPAAHVTKPNSSIYTSYNFQTEEGMSSVQRQIAYSPSRYGIEPHIL